MDMPSNMKTYLAWTFHEVLPGTFKRNKKQFAHHDYPILGPLPAQKASTKVLEDCGSKGPCIYFVVDGRGKVCYVGKSKEASVIKRWVRPGLGGPASHYWTHSTQLGGCVFNIADGIREGQGPYSLRYAVMGQLMASYSAVFCITPIDSEDVALEKMERGLIGLIAPAWNG